MRCFMGRIIWLFLICFFVGIGFATAQTQRVTGTVISAEDGQAVVGASVVVKGTTLGTITDLNGHFYLTELPNSVKTLLISFVGMQPQEVDMKPNLKVVLKLSSQQLDEVMVVAYGTIKKASFTGAASTIQAESAFKDMPITTFEQALQGNVPGLTVNQTSGQAGTSANVRVRGTGSMNASNSPLYVVDGVPVISGSVSILAYGGDTRDFNVMSSLNPDDIETVTVLKDAAAASLYGSRAANGVILITTKKGKVGKTSIRLKANWGISDWAVDNRPSVTGEQQRELTYEAFYNQGVLVGGYTDAEAKEYADSRIDLFAPELTHYSNWKDALFKKNASTQNYEFSAQGGNEQTQFYASLGYNKEEGMVIRTGFEGFTGRLNVSHKSKDNRLQVGANISFAKQLSRMADEGTSYNNPYYLVNWLCIPNIPVYNEDGSYYDFKNNLATNSIGLINPAKNLGLASNTSNVFKSVNALWAQYQIIEGLTLKQSVSYDFTQNDLESWWPSSSQNGIISNGTMMKIPFQNQNLYSSTILNYVHVFGAKHTVDVLAGWDVDMRHDQYVASVSSNFPSDRLPEMINGANPKTANSSYSDDRVLSFLSRVNYDYDGKYYASANFRRDGSSRLGINQRWANFWSVSAAWRMSQESFLKDVSFLDDLKIRMSYGVNGTLPKGLYANKALITFGKNYMNNPGSLVTQLANPDLSWEKNYNLNMGFDLRVFDRVGLAFDFYNRNTTDLLQDLPISMVTGFSSILKNVGEMNNRGVELDINVDVFKDSQMKWTTGLVLSHNRNRIVKLQDGKDIIGESGILREGESYYSWWSREWAGVDPATGEEQWVLNTPNEDGSFNRELTKDPSLAQRVVIGNPDPVLIGGWRNSVSWKGLTLNGLFSFSLGGHVLDDMELLSTSTDGETAYTVISVEQLNRWQKPGDITDVPRRINDTPLARYGSDRFMRSSNYLRLKNVSLSYMLPSKWTRVAKMDNVRVFFSGSNLLTWSAYKTIDPEQPVNGISSFVFPVLKTFTFGIEIGL